MSVTKTVGLVEILKEFCQIKAELGSEKSLILLTKSILGHIEVRDHDT